jgi:hypothetical protein
MAKLDEIIDMWEVDSAIDDNHLGEASTTTAKLHAKYLKLLIDAKLRKTKLDIEFNSLRKTKIRYYKGELSRTELADLGWDQWQYNKPLKAEMEEFLKGDDDLSKILIRADYMDTMVYALESIMQQIKQRDFQLSNGIKWKQFLAGM